MTIKEKVNAVMPLCGAHANLSDPTVSEILGGMGYDYLFLDLEHTPLSAEQAHLHLLASRAAGTPMFVRLPADDLTVTKKVLEMGPDGVIFPMVRDYEHACQLMANTLYPPYGIRGCGPKGAVRYGMDNEPYYYGEGHLKMCRFAMIELKSAALDAERIASIPYLDGCLLGMQDLSGSIERLGDIFCEENVELAMKAIKAFQKAGKTVAVSTYATDEATLRRYRDMGINMITTGADYVYMVKGGMETLKTIRGLQGTEK